MRLVRRALAAALVALLWATGAQAQPYDPALSFSTLETPHFLVHFHQGEEALAQKVARDAERAHALLSPLLGHAPRERTHVMLVDTDDSANGYAIPVPYNTVQLLAAAPTSKEELNQYEDWVWQLVVHEYTHILHLDTIDGPSRLLNAILGKRFFPNGAWPRWFTEGLAVHEESVFSRGGRVRSTLHDMQLRVMVLDGGVLPLEVLSNPPLTFPRRASWYLYGGRFVDFLAQRYGTGAIRDISHDNGASLIPYFLGTISKRATGKTFDELYAEWQQELLERYQAQAKAVGTPTAEERLTDRGETRRTPRLSPDGRTLYSLLLDADRRPRLMALDVATGGERTVVELQGDGALTVLADGRVLVGQPEIHHNFQGYEDLFLVDPKSGDVDRVTHGARLSEPDVDRTGRIVCVKRVGPARTALVLFDSLDHARRGEGRILHEAPSFQPVASPRFSPDGKRIAFVEHRDTSHDLRLLDLDTGALSDLTHDAAQDLEPAFSADGARVLFSSDRTGIFDVYDVDLAGRDVRRRTRVVGGAFEALETSNHLYFVRYGVKGYDLSRTAIASEPAPASPEPPAAVLPDESCDVQAYPARDYRALDTLFPTYWLPLVAADARGPAFGATLGGVDVLQRYRYTATALYGIDSGEPGFGLTFRSDATWPALTLSASRAIVNVPGAPASYAESRLQGRVGISLAFRRMLSGAQIDLAYNIARLAPSGEVRLDPRSPPPPERGLLAEGILGLSYTSARRFTNAISSEEGRRLSLQLRGGTPLIGSDFQEAAIAASWSEFVRNPLPFESFSHHVLAFRLSGGTSVGDLGGRQQFGLGGPRVIDFANDIVALQSPQQLLRGYPVNVVSGRAFALLSAEYRFPLLEVDWGFSTLPVFVRRLHAAAFTDVGDAFTPDVRPFRPRVGVGAELRAEVFFGYQLDTDLRVGYARGLSAGGENQLLLLVGTQF